MTNQRLPVVLCHWSQTKTPDRGPYLRLVLCLSCWIWVLSAYSLPVTAALADPTDGSDRFEKIIAPAIQTHCGKCHGEKENPEGDVNLLRLKSNKLSGNVGLIQDLINVLDFEEMPPEEEPKLDPKLRRQLVNELRAVLAALVAKGESHTHSPIRRMNRFQYNNSVIDLLDLKSNVFTLPERMMREHRDYFQPATGKMADVVTVGSRPLGKSQLIEKRLAGVAAFPQDLRAENGFDNRGDHLSMSPLLMESFLNLGQSITQSPDFVPKNVGRWNDLFAEPGGETDQASEIRARLKPLLMQAFRRPLGDSTLERYTQFVSRQISSGIPFEKAMKSAVAAAISSPKFLYLYDKSSDNHETAIDDFELASRLSFFLWGSLPDRTLLELASASSLTNPEILKTQFDRMLADKKLKRFCDSFPTQWLQLERIISSVPNPQKYPTFYFLKYRSSMHMMLEPLLLFETVLIENQSITQLIDPDFTYRSGLLQKAYGELGKLPPNTPPMNGGGVALLTFHRIPVTDRRNGGVITNAAVMTMTSGPERTQPITRGAWVAGVIFNNPPKPPPADVPALGEEPSKGQENMTLRERLSLHRKQANCRGCHQQIDPLGFALENYDPVGAWRNEYENGRKVDMAGTLFRNHGFNSIIEFKDAILAEKNRFTRALAGHLLSYGLAREIGAADQQSLDKIVKMTSQDDYRIQTLLREVVLSDAFQRKSNPKTTKPIQ